MDVSLWKKRLILSVFVILVLLQQSSCGNKFDLSKESGRQARIDEANFHLSRGECTAALAAINPLYGSPWVTDEIRNITASAYACSAGFNLLTFASNLSGASNVFTAFAKSMSNTANDGARAYLYSAIDVLTENSTKLSAAQRSTTVNTYMVFLQMGTISAILRNYGAPSSTGGQTADLIYTVPASTPQMTDMDACALAGAFSALVDSYSNSSLSDTSTAAAVSTINASCPSGVCTSLNKNRTLCDGSNQNSIDAAAVVVLVNAGW